MNSCLDFIKQKNITHTHQKWINYYEIYDNIFKIFKNKNPTILEIGCWKGGGLELYNYCFDNKCSLIGLDIDKNCKQFEKDFNNCKMYIKSQDDPYIADLIMKEHGLIDIIIDDGSHKSEHQITSFLNFFKHLKDGGYYLCEDVHTSYWPHISSHKPSFIDFCKELINIIHYDAIHHSWGNKQKIKYINNTDLKYILENLKSIKFNNGIIVFEKKNIKPTYAITYNSYDEKYKNGKISSILDFRKTRKI